MTMNALLMRAVAKKEVYDISVLATELHPINTGFEFIFGSTLIIVGD